MIPQQEAFQVNRRPHFAEEPSSVREGGRPEREEMLIVDHRAHFAPAELVEHKLSILLGGAVLPASYVRMGTRLGSRRPR